MTQRNRGRRLRDAPTSNKAIMSAVNQGITQIKQMVNRGNAAVRAPRRTAPARNPAPPRNPKIIPGRNFATGAKGPLMGKEYYDAFTMHPSMAMTAMSIGAATPVGAVAVDQITTDTTHPTLLIVYPHSSIKAATKIVKSSETASDEPSITSINSTTWGGAEPHEVIPTRCSIRIANATQRFQQGGVVRTLRATTGQSLPKTNAEFQDICNRIKTNDRVRVKDGAELKDQKQLNAVVIDGTRANNFAKFGDEYQYNPDDPTITVNNELALKAGIQGDDLELYEPAMSPIYILFEPFVVAQQYEFTIRSHYLCHYPSGTLLNNLAVHLPANPMVLNNKRDKEEAKGSNLINVAIKSVETALQSGLALAQKKVTIPRHLAKVGGYYKQAQSAAELYETYGPLGLLSMA